jgi:hypothetical protein
MLKLTQYEYNQIINLAEYDYDAKEWLLPSYCIVGIRTAKGKRVLYSLNT